MRIEYKVATLAHLALINQSPRYIQDLVKQHIPARDLRSSHTGPLLLAPRTKLSISERAFSSAAPAVWNALPVNLCEVPAHNIFKKQLKTFLFSNAYNTYTEVPSGSILVCRFVQ